MPLPTLKTNLVRETTPRSGFLEQYVAHGAAGRAAFEWLVCSPRPGERGRYPMKQDIPATWLNSMTIDSGGFPTLGVGRRGSRVMLRTSRSVYVISLLTLAAGIALCVTDVGPLLWVFGPPLIIGAIVAPIAVPVANRFIGTTFEIDLAEQIVTLSRRNRERHFPFERIVALQQLDAPRRGGGQINLVFSNDDGKIDRTCIYAHVIRYFVRRIAHRFAPHVPWPVIGADGQAVG